MLRTSCEGKFCLVCLVALSAIACQWVAWAEERSPQPAGQASPARPDLHALVRRASALADANRPAEAEATFKEALTAAEQLQGPRSAIVADVLVWLVHFYRSQQRYDDAWKAAERGLLIRQELLGPDDFRSAEMHGLLGSIALWQHNPARAEQHFRAVVESYDRRPEKKNGEKVAGDAAMQLGPTVGGTVAPGRSRSRTEKSGCDQGTNVSAR
jgi:tetratricopeptide (TPR) repeat protein